MTYFNGRLLEPYSAKFLQTPHGQALVKELEETSRHIQELYDSGTPLFTKDTLRACAHQVEAFKRDEEVFFTMMGIDGVEVKVTRPMRCPDPSLDPDDPDIWIVPVHPGLTYRPIEALTTSCDIRTFSRRKAYISVVPSFLCDLRYIHDKTLLVNPPFHSVEDLYQIFMDAATDEVLVYFQQVRSILASSTVPPNLSKLVAFGLGSLTYKAQPKYTPIFQHKLLVHLRDLLSSSSLLSSFAQDPAYTEADKKVLARTSIQVIDDPRGFLEVDPKSVVLSIAPNVPVREIIADIRRPGVILWNAGGMKFPCTDPESARVTKMLQDDDVFTSLPDSQHFRRLGLYVRRTP